MCGIVGAVGNIYKKEKEVVAQLLFADTFRGYDSTGIVSVSYLHNVRILKKAMSAPDFLQLKAMEDLMSGVAIIGHNRWATKGAVNNKNAHPFRHGAFSGVHNGTLRKQHLLPDSKDFDVDSENIYYSFDKIGIEETIEKLCGAFALVWFNEETKQVQMVRNHERPLHYAFSKDMNTLFYASEAKMLDWILDRNKVEHKGILEVKVGHLYSFNVNVDNKKGITSSMRKVKLYDPPATTATNTGKAANTSNVTKINTVASAEEQLKKFLGKRMDFTVGPKRQGYHYGRDCYTLVPAEPIQIDGRDIEVRVLDNRVFKGLATAKEEGWIVSAEVADYANDLKKPSHLFVKTDTIEYFEVTEEEDSVEEDAPFLFGFYGEKLSEKEWTMVASNGCSWCGNPLDPKDKNVFITKTSVLCPDCFTDQDVQDYINVGGKFL